MADVKISGLPASTVPLAGTEVLPIVQSGATKQVSIANVTAGRSVTATNFIPSGATIPTNGMYLPSANNLAFATDSVNRMQVSSLGVSVIGQANSILSVTSVYGAGASVIDFNASGATAQDTRIIGGAGSSSNLGFYTGGGTLTQKLNIGSSGDVTVSTGNLVIGTSGKGIDFSATAGTGTSELLADYEEGTWTPVVTSGTGSITSYVASGVYTKIGRVVNLSWIVAITDNGTGASFIQVTGAPFSAAIGNTAFYSYNQSSGASGAGPIVGTTLYMTNYLGSYPVATGQTLNAAITYIV